jgi:hypothetical protein
MGKPYYEITIENRAKTARSFLFYSIVYLIKIPELDLPPCPHHTDKIAEKSTTGV